MSTSEPLDLRLPTPSCFADPERAGLEADAVFAADGMSRLTGIPGVAAVTAGPGVTNTITAQIRTTAD